jgi:carbamoyltransferase
MKNLCSFGLTFIAIIYKVAKILGISAFYHDSAAALTVDGEIIAAVQEERFTREKHTAEFPVEAIKYCLEESGLRIDELDAIVFYDKPILKFERLLQTYYSFAPKGLVSFLKAIPVWINEKLFLKKMIYDGLKEVGNYDRKSLKLLFSEHHLSHAASSFYASPYEEAAILTIDGVGEWCTASIAHGKGSNIEVKQEMNFPHSIGLLYSAFTYFLGFKVNSGEYKLMGLAPYGNPNADETNDFIDKIKSNLIDIKSDGSLFMDQSYFGYATGLKMIKTSKWEKLFSLPKRKEESELTQSYCNLALAIQKVTEEVVLKMAQHAKNITGSENICLAGGVALNCVANGELIRAKIFENVYIQPASGDAGGALGACWAIHYLYFENERTIQPGKDAMKGAYLGPDFVDKEILSMSKKTKADFIHYEKDEELFTTVAKSLADGKVVGWFQGRMEFGPRALGNRSILGDARNEEMQKTINLKIKFREGYRPFAPIVLKEDANKYFDLTQDSPYMLVVAPVKENIRMELPENYYEIPLFKRLYVKRSNLQAITHVDFSARIQTVSNDTNQKLTGLLNAFKSVTGESVLVNTSFNVRGEPIVCTPFDAYRCFMSTNMDVLVLNNYVYIKSEQPKAENKGKWQIQFEKD